MSTISELRRTAVKVIDDICKLELKAALLREGHMYIEEDPLPNVGESIAYRPLISAMQL